ncbi:MAG: hypothetical protein HZB56_01810 [Deltaproteobacteria bacterium]|nr:hypothetical protein [Deltaproteobacteria bacterium]
MAAGRLFPGRLNESSRHNGALRSPRHVSVIAEGSLPPGEYLVTLDVGLGHDEVDLLAGPADGDVEANAPRRDADRGLDDDDRARDLVIGEEWQTTSPSERHFVGALVGGGAFLS